MNKYSVVIPVFNSASSLVEIAERVKYVFKELGISEFEILFINDGSTNPATKTSLLTAIHTVLPEKTRIINLKGNFGQHAATICGFSMAKGNFIITMDDDLQHSPEDITLLLQKQDHDVVIGLFDKKAQPLKRRFFSFIKKKLDESLLGKPKKIKLSSFRLLKKGTVESIIKLSSSNPYIPALILKVTKDIVNVKLSHSSRKEGISGYTWKKAFSIFLNLLKARFVGVKAGKTPYVIDNIIE